MGQIIKAAVDGVEQEFEVLGGHWLEQGNPQKATHVFDCGQLMTVADSYINKTASDFTFLRLIRPRHTFGQILLEETGERKALVNRGEFYVNNDTGKAEPMTYGSYGFTKDVTILRPVAIEAQE